MSDKPDPRNDVVEPNDDTTTTDQLANEALDQVVGGSGTANLTAPGSESSIQDALKFLDDGNLQTPTAETPHLYLKANGADIQ